MSLPNKRIKKIRIPENNVPVDYDIVPNKLEATNAQGTPFEVALPQVSGDDTLVTVNTNQEINGQKTFNTTVNVIYGEGINILDDNGDAIAGVGSNLGHNNELLFLDEGYQNKPLFSNTHGPVIFSDTEDYYNQLTFGTSEVAVNNGEFMVGINAEEHKFFNEEGEEYFLPESGGTLATAEEVAVEIDDLTELN